MIEGISAVTLGTHEMPRAVRFYRALGFEVLHGGENASFTSFRAGTSYLNLIAQPTERHWSWWGRVIFYVADVDALYDRALAAGYRPATGPRDAEWGERFFHLIDPVREASRTRAGSTARAWDKRVGERLKLKWLSCHSERVGGLAGRPGATARRGPDSPLSGSRLDLAPLTFQALGDVTRRNM